MRRGLGFGGGVPVGVLRWWSVVGSCLVVVVVVVVGVVELESPDLSQQQRPCDW